VTAEGPFARPGPRWFTIPAHRPFTLDLARGLAEALAPLGPEALAEAVVLTPTRRGARALAEAFLAVSGGKAVLLPQVRALGDLDEGEPPFEPGDLALDLSPAITPYRRRFELARVVVQNGRLFDRPLDAAAALELADALAGFLDSLQIEEADGSGIDALVPADMARHWQTSRRRDREEHHGREVAPCPVCRVRSEAGCARVCGLPLNDGLLVQASPCLSFTLLSLISPVTALPT
jgi:ATP-dependent helicase/nuclease subunit B